MPAVEVKLHPLAKNRPNEWKIEQGLSGAVLPVLDMTEPETKIYLPQVFGDLTKDEEAIKAVGDRNELFKMERKGWKGWVLTLGCFSSADSHHLADMLNGKTTPRRRKRRTRS